MDQVRIKVNGRDVATDPGNTILQACREAGVRVPTLCHLEDVASNASCGVCVVEVTGARSLVRSCVQRVSEGMEIATHSARAMEARRTNVELMLANHPQDCLGCSRNQACELQAMAHTLGVSGSRFVRTKAELPLDETSAALRRDDNKCILCGRCVAVCAEVQTVHAINFSGRSSRARISTYLDQGLGNVACTQCGQCALVCPTGAITERDATRDVWRELQDPERVVLVQTAPAIRVAIGEAMGMGAGALVTGRMVAGLRRLGFAKVFDTNFTADLTILEEGNELIQRISSHGTLPMVTSCSPGWIKFVEHFYPEQLGHLSTCKSPQQMFGAVAKTFYAEKTGIDPRKISVVSIMPCTAKKYEAHRPEMRSAFAYWKRKLNLADGDAFDDVDHVLTTRELARMFEQAGVEFAHLPEERFDSPLGMSSGAADLFGVTGGVMEAALRTAYEVMTGEPLPSLDLKAVRGMEGIREAELEVNGAKVKVAVAHTLKNARVLLEQIKKGQSPYTFIEVMTCPGGCLGGGGQPIPTTSAIRARRAESIYAEDAHKPVRKSHDNPEVKALYAEFLKEPLGHLSHALLHTHYVQRGVFTDVAGGVGVEVGA